MSKNCLICKKQFKIEKPYRLKVAIYCSRTCYWIGKRGKIMKNKGRPLSLEHRLKLSGENANNWQGGISTKNEIARKRIEYKLWRIAVFMRDNYICQMCNQKGGKLEADHIKPFAYFPELRYAIDNGRTLCINCHRQTDTWGGRAFKYKELWI